MNKFNVNYNENGTKFPHYWEMCVGSGHAYTALREDYRKQLKRAHDELGFRYVRFHGIFNDDMCVCIEKKDYLGNATGIVYNFVNIDNIFDFLISIDMKPFVELGFMPTCLAEGETTCFHFKGNITPPKDYDLWYDFIKAFVEHCVERYGVEEVRTWFFEVWNEPNLSFFWDGTKAAYFKLYEYSAKAIKSVDEKLQVGGPATSINVWIIDIREYCQAKKVPLDFISTHHYPTDDPLWKNSDISMEEFFASMGDQFGKYERGIIKKMTVKAKEEAGDYPLYYTEWNTSAMTNDDQHDEHYASAMIAKILADNDGLVKGYAYWTFTDIFEESSQLAGVFHGGFGLQTYAGIAKPAYRLFELYHGLGDTRLSVTAKKVENETLEMIATKTKDGIRCILYNHQVPDKEIKEEACIIYTKNMPEIKKAILYRIDEEHANPKKAWEDMGAPNYVKQSEIELLHKASELVQEELDFTIKDGELILNVSVPIHGVCGIDLII